MERWAEDVAVKTISSSPVRVGISRFELFHFFGGSLSTQMT